MVIIVSTARSLRHTLYYCGRPLPSLCPCKTVWGNLSNHGCQQRGRCGPTDGHNYAYCQKFDLEESGLPLQGYVVEPMEIPKNVIHLYPLIYECSSYFQQILHAQDLLKNSVETLKDLII